MTQDEEYAVLGKAVKEHSEALRRVLALSGKANKLGNIFERLADSFKLRSPEEIVRHGENLLFLLRQEKTDWSDLTDQTLEGLVAELKAAIQDRNRLADDKRRLGASD